MNNLCFLIILLNYIPNNTSHLCTCQKYSKPQKVNICEHLSSVYLKVVKRKEGLRLSSLFLNVLNTISAGLLRVNNDGIHVFSQNLRHSNLILLLSGLAQVNETAILKRGTVCLLKWHEDVDQLSRNCIIFRFPHHRARVQSFDALHDLSLALLTTVLLSVDSGVTQLLHYLQNQAK